MRMILALLIVAGVAGSALATPTATYTLGDVSTAAAQFNVPFDLTASDSMYSAKVTLEYDSTKVDFVSASTPIQNFKIAVVNDNQHPCSHANKWVTVLVEGINYYDGTPPGTQRWLNFTFNRVACGATNVTFPLECASWTRPNSASTLTGYPLTYGDPYNNISVDGAALVLSGCGHCPPDCNELEKPTAIAPAPWSTVKGLYR